MIYIASKSQYFHVLNVLLRGQLINLGLTLYGNITMLKTEAKQFDLSVSFNLLLAGIGLTGVGYWILGVLMLALAYFVSHKHL